MEPILLRYATQHGFPCRFKTRFLEFTQGPGGVETTLEDGVLNTRFKIKSKYLFGADGARSRVVEQLQLPMSNRPSQGIALNVLVRADLLTLLKDRIGLLHYVIRPDIETADFAGWAIVRMVKPWNEWLIILMYKPNCPPDYTQSEEQVARQVSAVIDNDAVQPEILRIDKWVINETVAQKYSDGRV